MSKSIRTALLSLVLLIVLVSGSFFMHGYGASASNASTAAASSSSSNPTAAQNYLPTTNTSAKILLNPVTLPSSTSNTAKSSHPPLLIGKPVPISPHQSLPFTPQSHDKGFAFPGKYSPATVRSSSTSSPAGAASNGQPPSAGGASGVPGKGTVGFNPGDGYCGAPASCGDLTFHGGGVQHSPTIVILLWDPTLSLCSSHDYDPNTNDCAYASLLVAFFEDLCTSGNPFFSVINQYTDGSGSIGSCSVYGNNWWYYTSPSFPSGGYLSDGDIQNIAGDAQNGLGLPASDNTFIMVFVPGYEPSCSNGSPGSGGSQCFDAGSGQIDYCAYHSWFYTSLGLFNAITYAAMPDAATASVLCGLGVTSPNSDPYADLEVSPASHEAAETMTDPMPGLVTGDGWYYSDHQHEIGDECAYDFVGTESDGSNVHMGSSQGSPGPFEIQSEWSNANGGCTLDLNGAPTLVQVTLNPDKSTGTTAQDWSFPFYYVEGGENSYYSLTSTSTTSTNYVWVTPNYYFFQYPSCGSTCESSNSGYAFCFGVECDYQYAQDTNSYATTYFVSYYYYELLEQQPSMVVFDGGNPPSADISYVTAPSCGYSCNGVADGTKSVFAALPVYPSLGDIFAVWGSTASTPTCDPASVVFNGGFHYYCGTNSGSFPSERWYTIQGTSACLLGSCKQFSVSGEYVIEGITYYNQFLTHLSFSVSDGSNDYTSNPVFKGYQFGVSTSITLSTTASNPWLDAASWTATSTLKGSSTTQRWYAPVHSGTISSSSALNIVYDHQYHVILTITPTGTGKTSPSTGWFNANIPVAIKATPGTGYAFKAWNATTGITFASSTSASTTVTVKTSGTIRATFQPGVKLTLSQTSISLAPGSSGGVTATVKGVPQSVKFSYASNNTGIKATFGTNPITDSLAGITDGVTVHVGSGVAAGTYQVTINAKGADGVVSSVTIMVKVS